MASDDTALLTKIMSTHSHKCHEIDVTPILHIVDDILSRVTLHVNTPGPVQKDVGLHPGGKLEDDKADEARVVSIAEALSSIIDRISGELACKCVEGGDGDQTAISLLTMLSSYSWEAKLVITLAAFALNYGEFGLLAQIYSSNPLAKSMAILKRLPVIMEHSDSLRPMFETLSTLIKAMLVLARCIVEFKKLPSMYMSLEIPALSTAKASIPTAVYWTVRGVVACITQIITFTSIGHKYRHTVGQSRSIRLYTASTSNACQLSTLALKINSIHDDLKKKLDTCYLYIDEKRDIEAYESLVHIFDKPQTDNMKVLRPLINSKDDLQPLYDGSSKIRVNLDVLKSKNVLLLISGLDVSQIELSILGQKYNESQQHATRMDSPYEVVWVPIVDRLIKGEVPMQRQFETLQSTMPWYTVHHPSIVGNGVARFVRERWLFRNKPILVVLDRQGNVMSPNAIHMMWIWGSNAFPFTKSREEALWKEETWRLELLVNGIDPTERWIKEGKYIFLYGGDDIDWIRKFTSAARSMAQEACIPLEMVYVGRRTGKKELVRRVIATITDKKLSDTWEDLMIWLFWTRLESMLFSKIQLGHTDDHDPIMKEIKKLLSYDTNGGWAVLSHGNEVFVNGHGTSTVLPTMSDYKIWEEHIAVKGFEVSFKDYHDKLDHTGSQPCCRLEFPSAAGRILDHIKCPECLRHMDKYRTFMCCHD